MAEPLHTVLVCKHLWFSAVHMQVREYEEAENPFYKMPALGSGRDASGGEQERAHWDCLLDLP